MTGIEYYRIGKILKPQGHRGAVRVMPLTDNPGRFRDMSRVRVNVAGSRVDLHIEEIHSHQEYVILKFKEITDMNMAEKLAGGYLEVLREELLPLPRDSYYIFDIIGLSVLDASGLSLGKVTDVIQTGANDVYVVETGGKPLLIPALKKVVREIDLAGRRMVVELPEGLRDDEI